VDGGIRGTEKGARRRGEGALMTAFFVAERQTACPGLLEDLVVRILIYGEGNYNNG